MLAALYAGNQTFRLEQRQPRPPGPGEVRLEVEAHATVDAAWNVGIRYFDTAPHHGLGLSERRLGEALTGHPRDGYVLSTKVGRLLMPLPEPQGVDCEGVDVPAKQRRVWDFSRDGVLRR